MPPFIQLFLQPLADWMLYKFKVGICVGHIHPIANAIDVVVGKHATNLVLICSIFELNHIPNLKFWLFRFKSVKPSKNVYQFQLCSKSVVGDSPFNLGLNLGNKFCVGYV